MNKNIKLLGDVWVNFVYGGLDSVYVPEYFEWRRDDEISIYNQLPIVHVSKEDYDNIGLGFKRIPLSFLEPLTRLAHLRRNSKEGSNYSFIISDGVRVLVIYTGGKDTPTYKSKIIPRQERTTLEVLRDLPVTKVNWDEVKDVTDYGEGGSVPLDKEEGTYSEVGLTKEYMLNKIAHVFPSYHIGCTRRERELKELVLECLYGLASVNDDEEVTYWFNILIPNYEGNLEELSSLDKLNIMHDKIKDGWSKEHYDFGRELTQYSSVYKDVWDDVEERFGEAEQHEGR